MNWITRYTHRVSPVIIRWWTLPVCAVALMFIGVVGLLLCALKGRTSQLNLYLLRTSYAIAIIGLAAWALWFAASTAIYTVQNLKY